MEVKIIIRKIISLAHVNGGEERQTRLKAMQGKIKMEGCTDGQEMDERDR